MDGKILIVDDEQIIRGMLQTELEDNFEVETANNAIKELELCEKNTYDLVISDINMPGIKGYELLNQIKEKYPKTKVALITAYNVDDYVRMAKERNSIAAKYISEGKGAQARILGEMDRELREIESGAKRTEKEILGKAEAAATKALAAVDVDPEFFEFWQTLRLYKASFGKGDTMYLSTDSRLLNLMNNGLNFGD